MPRPSRVPRGRRPAGNDPPAPRRAPPSVRLVAWAGTGVAAVAVGLFALVAAVVLRTDGQDRWDVTTRGDLLDRGGRTTAALARAATVLERPLVVVLVGVLAVVLLWRWAGRPLLGLGVVAVAVATGALVQLLALALSDVRPTTTTLLGVPLFDGSFPSVRTADAEALWGMLALAGTLLTRRAAARVLCGAVGVLISVALAWGQLDRGHVWPSDVLGGWLLGVAAVGAAAVLLSTWPVPPTALPTVPPVAPPEPTSTQGRGTGARSTTLSR